MTSGDDLLTRESLIIGHVVEVSPSSVTVSVDVEAPQGTSFVNGALQRFPRINGFVVLPCEDGAILAIVLWIGIDDGYLANRDRPADVLGLPVSRRRLRAVPLGLLRTSGSRSNDVRIERGALLFPSVGDPVRLPTPSEAAAVVPAIGRDETTRDGLGIQLGVAPMASYAPVSVRPDRLFGRHLAILGNTGSGKSCTMTHAIRASALQTAESGGTFRAVVLDLNGEYEHAFDDLGTSVPVKRYAIDLATEGTAADSAGSVGAEQLRVPYWLWNYREWHAFVDPSGKSQAPVLRQALHMLRTSNSGELPSGVITLIMGRRVVREFRNQQIPIPSTGLSALDQVMASCGAIAEATGEGPDRDALRALYTALDEVLAPQRANKSGSIWVFSPEAPNLGQCDRLLSAFDQALDAFGVPDIAGDISQVDIPVPFDARDMVELLRVIAVNSSAETAGWVAPMQDRLEIAMSDERLVKVCGYEDDETLAGWISSIAGPAESSQITVLDLSLVPTQAQQVVAGVLARVLLETLERQRRLGHTVPIILAVEEAHALIRRRSNSIHADGASGMSDLCREAFERIGREGRKFGLSLVISSQRPSELSETVLSQCNSFLVHRIVNARDQDFVRRLVPDNLGALLDEVASYPARTALLVGAAAEIPVLIEVTELAKRHRPDAADPEFELSWRSGTELNAADIAASWAPEPTRHQSESGIPLRDDDPPF